MKKKVAVSFLIMALVCALIGGATFAYFRDTVTTANQEFTAGILDIDGEHSGAFYTPTLTMNPMAPGEESEASILIDVENSNLDMYVKVIPKATGAIWADANHPTVAATEGLQIYPTGDFNSWGGFNHWMFIDPANGSGFVRGTENSADVDGFGFDMDFRLKFPWATGNSYQGKTGTLQFQILAVQADNVNRQIYYEDNDITNPTAQDLVDAENYSPSDQRIQEFLDNLPLSDFEEFSYVP